ncbi:MAG: hypothetical protein JNJ60_18135 [Rhodocyclaceae bacterium]|nr:hypothetical protein [Rhodocyclaceae bacterium]
MAEPHTAAAAWAAGLTILGVATGLHPGLLIAGLAGGLWALSYRAPQPLPQRIAAAFIAPLAAGWLTPAAVAAVTSLSWWPAAVTADLLRYPVAMGIGLTAYQVHGRTMLRIAAKRGRGGEVMGILVQVLTLVATTIIFWRAEPALNRMGRGTPWLIRASFHCLALGAAELAVYILAGDVSGWPTVGLACGAAMLLVCERRVRVLVPGRKGNLR